MIKKLGAVMLVLLSAEALATANGNSSVALLARLAASPNREEAAKAAVELRAMGPAGMAAFIDANREALDAAAKTSTQSGDKLLASLDALAQQKDSYWSGLYWYTDIGQAKAAAQAADKPILSLRLLGRLDEDLSCANSRYFRITLYANPQISSFLREHFVLHWESVRPVPKLVIDFGDGRKMERTLTGNSIHYVLDSDGRVVDALPGVYGPGAFLKQLTRGESAASTLGKTKSEVERIAALRHYHQTRIAELDSEWQRDVRRAGLAVAPSREVPPARAGSPSAQTAAPVSVTKALVVERPVLRGLSGQPAALDSIASDSGWSAIARLYLTDCRLDSATHKLMLRKDPELDRRGFWQAVKAFQTAIGEDTVRDEYIYHAAIHRWLSESKVIPSVDALNERVYSELFLTPSWDEWLGLRPLGAYSAIDKDGLLR